MGIQSAVIDYLSQFDAGIAPSANDVVNALSGHQPRAIRRTLSELCTEGIVQSRWDDNPGTYTYWV